MELDKFKGMYIQFLEWSFFKDDKEVEDYRNSYSIGSEYHLIGSTITGDILAVKENKLILIDHEVPKPENDFKLTKNLNKVKDLIEEIIQIPDFEEEESIKRLKKIKKQVKALRKLSPKNLKDHFEDSTEEINDKIWDLKNEIPEGHIWMEMINVREQLDQLLNRPKKYIEIDVRENKENTELMIYGWCSKADETINEVKNVITKLESTFPIKILFLKSFEEFKKERNLN